MSCNRAKAVENVHNHVKTEIRKLEGYLKEGILYTSLGNDVELEVDKLKGLDAMLSKGEVPENIEGDLGFSKSVFEVTVRKNLGGKFTGRKTKDGKVRYGTFGVRGVDTDGDTVTLSVEEKVNGVWVRPEKFTFTRGADKAVTGDTELRIPGVDKAFSKALREHDKVTNAMTSKEAEIAHRQNIADLKDLVGGRVLGSSREAKFDRKRFAERAGYVHGDVDNMKTLLDEMVAAGRVNLSEEQMAEYKGLLDGMHPSFFREMEVFINENGKTNAGWVDLGKNELYLQVNKRAIKGQTPAEVYMHEIIHTMTSFALRGHSTTLSRYKRELDRLMSTALENIKWQDLLPVDEKDANNVDKERAKATYDYVTSDENSRDEFLAYALTNPKLSSLLKDIPARNDLQGASVWKKMVNVFFRLMDIVLGNYEFRKQDNVYEAVHQLAFKLAEVNSNVEQQNIFQRASNALYDALNDTEGRISDVLEDMQEKVFRPDDKIEIPEDLNEIQKIVLFGKLIFKSISSPEYRKALGVYLDAMKIKPEGTVREFFRFFLTPDETAREVEFLDLKTNNIDMLRNTYASTAEKNIKDSFSRELDEGEEVAISKIVLDTNATGLMFGNPKAPGKKVYTNKKFREVLESNEVLEKRLKTAKNRLYGLAGEKRKYWVVNQAMGLGYYMATHKGHINQLSNSSNIARGILSDERHKIDPELVEAINEVASLNAIKYSNNLKQRKQVADLMRDEYTGMKYVFNAYENIKKESRSKLFDGGYIHAMDGYTKEIFDDAIDMQVRPISERAEMEKLGYRFEGRVAARNGVRDDVPVGRFVSDVSSKAERMRQAVSLGGLNARGTTLKESAYMQNPALGDELFRRNLAVVNKNRIDLDNAMKAGELDLTKVEFGMMPVTDLQGRVVDYRNMMDKKSKEEVLGMDSRMSVVLGRTASSIIDKNLREEQNENALELMKKDMKANWEGGLTGKDGLTPYRLIGPKATDKKMRELFYMLPRNIQEYVNSRADKTLAVRADLMNLYFGYKHMQLSSMKFVRELPNIIRRVIDMFEGVWIDLVKIVKTNILMKMPLILVSNIVSNILYAVNTFTSPTEIFGMYRESIKSVKAFMKAHKELVSLQTDLGNDIASLRRSMTPGARKKISLDIEKKQARIKQLEKQMSDSEVKELFDLGMYQAVIEDVNTNTMNDSNRITDGMDKLLNKAPVYVKTPLQWAYLSKETSWYKFNQEVLQLSDLVARDVMNRKQKQMEVRQANGEIALPREYRKYREEEMFGKKEFPRKKKLIGKEREEFFKLMKKARHEQLVDSFINYSRPNGAFEEYLNRIGLFMFTKYVKGIQRVILRTGAKYPLKTAMTLAGASAMLDVDNIQDQMFLAKAFGHDGDFGITNIFPVYSPFEHIMNVMTPAIVKEETYLGLV